MQNQDFDNSLRIETPCSDGRRLVVEFCRKRDRYAHRVSYAGSEGEPVTLLDSIEGLDGDLQPPSPALQGLNVDDLQQVPTSGGGVAMLIGMVGEGHWSVSLGPDPDAFDDNRAVVCYDAACRLKKAAAELRASYRVADAVLVERSERSATFRTYGVKWRLVVRDDFSASRPSCCRIEMASDAEWRKRPELSVVTEPGMSDEPPFTLRWRHDVELLS